MTTMLATLDKLTVRVITNPFDKTFMDIELDYVGQSVRDVLGGIDPAEIEVFRAEVNGEVLEPSQFDQPLYPSDKVVFYPEVGAPVLAAFAAAASWAAAAAASVWAALPGLIWNAALSAGISYAISALMPKPKTPSFADNSSQFLGWNQRTIQTEGAVIPIAYGVVRVDGNVCYCWTEPSADGKKQTLYAMIALSRGPIGGIVSGEAYINDKSIGHWTGVTMTERKGTLNQTAVWDAFKVEYRYDQIVTNSGGAETIEVPDKGYDNLEVDVNYQRGIYKLHDEKGLVGLGISTKVTVAEVGGSHYVVFDGSISKKTTSKYMTSYKTAYNRNIDNITVYGTDPVSVTVTDHAYETGDVVYFYNVGGTTELNNNHYTVTVVDSDTFTLDDTNSNYFTAYTSGGNCGYQGSQVITIDRTKRYEVRLEKQSADRDSNSYGDDVSLFNIRGVLEVGFTFPGLAYVTLEAISSDDLNTGFTFYAIIYGRVCEVYNPATGKFDLETSDNPADALYNIYTDPLIEGDGIGTPFTVFSYRGHQPSRLETADFVELQAMHNTTADDGDGGTEPLFTFNYVFDISQNRQEAALTVCEVARCMPVWSGHTLYLAIEKAKSISQVFVVKDIKKSKFEKTLLIDKDRAGEIVAYYKDQASHYEKTAYPVYSQSDYQNRQIVNLLQLRKRTEVIRALKALLNSNVNVLYSVEFETGIKALTARVGDRISVQHPILINVVGGEIRSAEASALYVDRELEMVDDPRIVVECINPETNELEVDTYTVLSIDPTTKKVTISDTLSPFPPPFSTFVYGSESKVTDSVFLTNTKRSGANMCVVTGVQYSEQCWVGDSETPTLPQSNLSTTRTQKSQRYLPSTSEVNQTVIESTWTPPTMDIPFLSNCTWSGNSVDTVSWAKTDSTDDIVLTYKGELYAITPDSSTSTYIYWPGSGTAFLGTDDIETAMAVGNWVFAYNDEGVISVANQNKIIHGGLIQADTITASKLYVSGITETGGLDLSAVDSGDLDDISDGSTYARMPEDWRHSGNLTLIDGNQIFTGTIWAASYAELRNTYVYNAEDSLDASYSFVIPFKIVSEMTAIVSIKLSFKILNFRAYTSAVAVGGDSLETSSDGGSGFFDTTGPSNWPLGGIDTKTDGTCSTSASSTSYTDYENLGSHYHEMPSHDHDVNPPYYTEYEDLGNHRHTMPSHDHDISGNTQSEYVSSVPGNHSHGLTNYGVDCSSEDPGDTNDTDLGTHRHKLPSSMNWSTSSEDPGNTYARNLSTHRHSIGTHTHTVPNHSHRITEASLSHDHGLTIPDHNHTVDIPGHTHTMQYGIYEEANSPVVHYHLDNGSGYGGASSNYTTDQTDIDITASISGTGWKSLKFDADSRCRIAAIIEIKLDITA